MIRAILADLAAAWIKKDSAWDILKIKVSRGIRKISVCVSIRSNDKSTDTYIFIVSRESSRMS